MTEFTPQDGGRVGTALVANAIGGTNLATADYFANTGREYMYITSTAGGTVYIHRTKAVDGNTPDDKAVVIPALTPVILGPFPTEFFSSTNEFYKAAGGTVSVAIIRI